MKCPNRDGRQLRSAVDLWGQRAHHARDEGKWVGKEVPNRGGKRETLASRGGIIRVVGALDSRGGCGIIPRILIKRGDL